jgi:hypothetical protein
MNTKTTTNVAAGQSNHLNIYTSGTSTFTEWSCPQRVDVRDTGHSIEMIYLQDRINRLWGGTIPQIPERRVFKIVYSCVNGQWHKSEPIFGEIIPAIKEQYVFHNG